MTLVRGVRRVIDALTWFIIGMVFMSRMYCINLGITSGVKLYRLGYCSVHSRWSAHGADTTLD
jgi:hypothetical protein